MHAEVVLSRIERRGSRVERRGVDGFWRRGRRAFGVEGRGLVPCSACVEGRGLSVKGDVED